MDICVLVWVYVYFVSASTFGDQRALDPLEVELQMVVSCPVCAWNGSGSSLQPRPSYVFFKQDLLLSLELVDLARWTGQWALGIFCGPEITRVHFVPGFQASQVLSAETQGFKCVHPASASLTGPSCRTLELVIQLIPREINSQKERLQIPRNSSVRCKNTDFHPCSFMCLATLHTSMVL